MKSKRKEMEDTKIQKKSTAKPHEWQWRTLEYHHSVSNWPTSYPISDQEFNLTKRQFWSLRIRYGGELSNTPSSCI